MRVPKSQRGPKQKTILNLGKDFPIEKRTRTTRLSLECFTQEHTDEVPLGFDLAQHYRKIISPKNSGL